MTTEEKQELTLTEEQVAELAWRRNFTTIVMCGG